MRPTEAVDGLPPGEGTFLTCSFWLVDNLAMLGRFDEARALFEHLLALRNDVGLLAEQYDPVEGRQLGNFPQAFSHVGLINSAHNLSAARGPAEGARRRGRLRRSRSWSRSNGRYLKRASEMLAEVRLLAKLPITPPRVEHRRVPGVVHAFRTFYGQRQMDN